MQSSRFPILIIGVLLALLGLLAFLQYRWLGQISDGERERLSRTIKADTERFAEDFNREIQNAYFNFQMNADVWQAKNWKQFNERYDFYKEKTAYPELIEDFYFVESGENPTLLKYQFEKKEFVNAEWNDDLNKLKPVVTSENPALINEDIPALLMPVHEMKETVERIVIRTENTENIKGVPKQLSKRIGVLVIKLDREIIENKILPDLAKKYFSENESADYNLSVVNKNNGAVFQKGEVAAPDASAKIFNVSPDKFLFFSNREILPRSAGEPKKSVVLNKFESLTQTKSATENGETNFDVKIISSEQSESETKPRVRILEGQMPDAAGIWTLNVQHSAGSLEQFITNTRNKNLAVSFGILSLLAVSIILIFVSSQRAKLFAQRQVDFVSSVSHEFRTPLAVIYSAGENLSDGVIRDENKIANYGNLIKREGKKLSAMVEQILEFAGANSRSRKYDFQLVKIEKVIDEAINECQPLIEKNNFTIEKEIAENLPEISADKRALTQAVQNLIANSIKYSNGEKFIKISANNGVGKVKISVEDRGLGIEKAELSKIFEPFYRSKKVVDAQIHGSGLGLSLVKQIVEAHNGNVKVESKVGKGSRFTITLGAQAGSLQRREAS